MNIVKAILYTRLYTLLCGIHAQHVIKGYRGVRQRRNLWFTLTKDMSLLLRNRN